MVSDAGGPESPLRSGESHADREFAEYCRRWLERAGMSYGREGRRALAQSHPALFGQAYEVTLTGYERWLARQRRGDSLESFARYMAGRYLSWRKWQGPGSDTRALMLALL